MLLRWVDSNAVVTPFARFKPTENPLSESSVASNGLCVLRSAPNPKSQWQTYYPLRGTTLEQVFCPVCDSDSCKSHPLPRNPPLDAGGSVGSINLVTSLEHLGGGETTTIRALIPSTPMNRSVCIVHSHSPLSGRVSRLVDSTGLELASNHAI